MVSPGAPVLPVWIDCPGCGRIYSRHITGGDWSSAGTLDGDAIATCPNCWHVVAFRDLNKRDHVWNVHQSGRDGPVDAPATIRLSLSQAEAMVLYDLLERYHASQRPELTTDRADRRALALLHQYLALSRVTSVQDYERALADARRDFSGYDDAPL